MVAGIQPIRLEKGRLLGIAGALFYVFLFALVYGLSFPLLTILMEQQGLSGVFIGASSLMQATGAILVAPLIPALFRLVGLGQMLALAAAVEVVGYLLIAAIPDPWVWLGIRLIIGGANGVVFFGAEHWIVAMASDSRRSRIVTAYTILIAIGFGMGPLVLAGIGVEGWLPFLLIAVVGGVAIVPVLRVRRYAPHFTGQVSFAEVPHFLFRYPVICAAAGAFGVINVGILSLLPAWAVRSGMVPESAAALVAFAGFGSICVQLVLGWVAGYMNTHRLMLICALVGVSALLAIPGFVGIQWMLWLLVLTGGGMFMGVYMLSLIDLGEECSGRILAIGNAAVVMSYSLGAVFGPLYGGAAMDAIPPDGLLYFMAGVGLVFLVILVWRGRVWGAGWRKPHDGGAGLQE